MQRMKWSELCAHSEYKGKWVALNDCHYDDETGDATEGTVVDSDTDLGKLCNRVRASEFKNCAILFCAAPCGGKASGTPADDLFRTSPH
jgi:hypothetical protein